MNESAAAGKMPWDVDLLSTADKLNNKRDAKAKTWWNVFPFLHDTKGTNSIWVCYGEGFIFRLWKDRERKKKKPGRNTSQALLCLSLSLGVLMRFVVASVCCAAPGSIGVCCLTVCGGRLWWWDRTDCVSNAHTYCHTQIQECPHTHTHTHTHIQHKQRNQFKDAHKNKLTNCVYIYIALSLSLSLSLQSLSLLHRCFCFKVWGLLSHFLSRGSFDHRCLRIFHGIGTHGLNLGPYNDDHRHNNHL